MSRSPTAKTSGTELSFFVILTFHSSERGESEKSNAILLSELDEHTTLHLAGIDSGEAKDSVTGLVFSV